MPDKKEK